jgi:mRNA-degrading endonuclease RelE of RelBE toxin-antitoxin system
LRFEFKPSFDRSIKSLDPGLKSETKAACLAFLALIEERKPLPSGIGLKRLRGDFWEFRRGIHTRILFRWNEDLVEFILAGDHDSIKNFLKNE